jgi:DNA modification methylase
MNQWLNRIHIGDALTLLKQMPDEFVHCTVTSPPYWGLRDYGVPGQLGLEKTPEEYVAKMVEVFGEVKRVSRPDATLWLNLGDSYCGGGRGVDEKYGNGRNEDSHPVRFIKPQNGLKPKDLCGIPWRVAFALQADGWYLRSDIIWAKPNPMPESVTDRPTKAHEYIFLLSKSAKYYFDQDAVREPATGWNGSKFDDPRDIERHPNVGRKARIPAGWKTGLGSHGSIHSEGREQSITYQEIECGRNIRTVWNIATQPYKEAHFATFPEEIPERCIKAGTSEKGCCPKCGKAWVRVVETHYNNPGNRTTNGPRSMERRHETAGFPVRLESETKTLGWQPSCSCGEEPVPCVVLDPFIGSGTVAKVAIRLRRNWVGIDLNPAYGELTEKRKAWTQVEMI